MIWALGGNDWIRGGAGADIIDGDAGFDWSDYGDSDERVYVDLLTHEALYGTAQGDILIRIEGLMGSIFDDGLVGDHERNDLRGNAGDDYLMGNGGDDALWGEAHNDTLEGGAGGDFLFGGAGIDRASYLFSTTGVTASLLRPGINRGDAAGDSYLSVENLRGSNFGDFLEGDFYDNEIEGLFGRDTILGGEGNDVLFGNWAGDWLFGEDGSDVLYGGDDDDILHGGMNGVVGPDRLIGGSGADRLHVERGRRDGRVRHHRGFQPCGGGPNRRFHHRRKFDVRPPALRVRRRHWRRRPGSRSDQLESRDFESRVQ